MRLYLDASVLVALVSADPFTARAEARLGAGTHVLVVSDFAAAEVASAIARRVRMREMIETEARNAFALFDALVLRVAERVVTDPSDVRAAEAALRRLDLPLRTPDALNIAIAQRVDATLLTFDMKMAEAAQALGLEVVAG
ncbi:type II toxin-antitoxin system VapC family toxin [Rhodopila globiformis]|uniref:type II toxin-antitoxin system VapC family toxin n=1 Tax=Rhodopila globiformis TaxID=1071 RepID=UPI0019569D0B|nr:type II toxin-antitoxin system VapC family toxin [Rhodopila globiformis]